MFLWAITEDFMKEVKFGLDLEKWVEVDRQRWWNMHSRENMYSGRGGRNEGYFLEAVRISDSSSICV